MANTKQEMAFMETIASMKRAMRRDEEDDDSHSGGEISKPTNRRNKLKRKARFMQEGRLDQADGPRSYKRRILYNDKFKRYIIGRKPARVDMDGEVVDDDDEDSNNDLTPAEEDPYEDVKIEELLMPLTAASNLDKHPSLSIPYRSKVLEEMVHNAQHMLHRERSTLWRAKQALVRFRGDNDFASCGTLETEYDVFTLRHPATEFATSEHTIPPETAPTSWDAMSNIPLVDGLDDAPLTIVHDAEAIESDDTRDMAEHTKLTQTVDEMQDSNHLASQPAEVTMMDTEDTSYLPPQNGDEQASDMQLHPNPSEQKSILDDNPDNGAEPQTTTETEAIQAQQPSSETDQSQVQALLQPSDAQPADEPTKPDIEMEPDATRSGSSDGEDRTLPAHRMTTRTRARAQATTDPSHTSGHDSPAPHSDTVAAIHPFFLVPFSANPTRNGGLPISLADDTRQLLSSYVQKQEEVVRQASAMLGGLQKALRLRRTVWSWCRAEAHVGEMSDGEDWVDEEEWGLDGPLKKGEEVEDDEVYGTGKKTRNRRAAGA